MIRNYRIDIDTADGIAMLHALERAAAMEEKIRKVIRVLSDPRVPGWIAKIEAFAREDADRWENEGGAL